MKLKGWGCWLGVLGPPQIVDWLTLKLGDWRLELGVRGAALELARNRNEMIGQLGLGQLVVAGSG